MSPFVRPAVIRPGDRVLASSVFFLLLAAYTATFAGLPDNPDAEVEFQTTSSLARRGTLALDPSVPLARLAIEAGHGVRPGGPGREDESFAWFGVGQALAAVPLYWAGQGLARVFPRYEEAQRASSWYGAQQTEYFQHLLVGWRNPLFAALTAWLLMLSSRRLGAGRLASWTAAMSYGLCTFAWPQARSTLSDVQGTFFLFLAFHQILRVREAWGRLHGSVWTNLLFTGLALGGALATRVATAPAVLALLVVLFEVLWGGRRRGIGIAVVLRDGALVLVPLAAICGALLAVNAARFGDPFETGYGGAVLSGSYFSFPPLQGAAGLLASPGKGLLWLAPGVLIFPLSLFFVRRRDPLAIWSIAAVFLVTLGLVAPTQGWHGAHTYGPRYLLPCLPFLWLGVGPGLDALAAAGKTWIGVALLSAGLVTSLPGVLVGYGTHLDLATRAAALEWPDAELGLDRKNADEERFQRIQWRWNYAAPWAHWRILRHRVAGLGEDFPLREIFFLDSDAALTPVHRRDQGFRHLAWIDFHARLGGPLWPAAFLVTLLLALGIVQALRGLDPGAA